MDQESRSEAFRTDATDASRAGIEAPIGIVGLGAMGRSLAFNAARHGFAVVGWDVDPERCGASLHGASPGGKVTAAEHLEDLVAALERPRRVVLMVPAGRAVAQVLDELVLRLEPDDVVVDGGNSCFRDTERRQEALAEAGIALLGVGISGGERGALFGPSVMAGGSESAWRCVAPVFERIAARGVDGVCAARLGPGGAGHFVKMAHNGIEYALLEAIAEVYDLLHRGLGLDAEAAAQAFARWDHGSLDSFLVDLAVRVLRVRDEESGRPLVELVEDRADQNGTGRWAVRAAYDLGVPVPGIAAAVDARLLSAHKQERIAGATQLRTGRPRARYRGQAGRMEGWLDDALRASQVVSFVQGFALIRAASEARGWEVPLSEVARIWTAGCIVRSAFLDGARAVLRDEPDLPNLLLEPAVAVQAMEARDGLVRAVAVGQRLGIPVPTLAASLAYLDAYRSEQLPQNLTQAQRDAFGAHTYRRADRPEAGPVHSGWQLPHAAEPTGAL